MALRSMHNGNLSFRFVSVPVKMHAAVSETSVKFHQCHQHDDGSASRIEMFRKCCACDQTVEYGDLVKGVEREDGTLVTVTDDEIAATRSETTDDFEVEMFVPEGSIDPIYYGSPYFLSPDLGKKGTNKKALESYALLREVMRSKRYVGIIKYSLRGKSHMSVLRVSGDVLVLQHIQWDADVRKPEFPALEQEVTLDPRAVEMAETIMDSMVDEYVPADFVNEDAEKVEELLAAKDAGWVLTKRDEEVGTEEVSDLLAQLEASIAKHPAGKRQPAKKAAPAKKVAPKAVRKSA